MRIQTVVKAYTWQLYDNDNGIISHHSEVLLQKIYFSLHQGNVKFRMRGLTPL
jgi:hypothetical protein